MFIVLFKPQANALLCPVHRRKLSEGLGFSYAINRGGLLSEILFIYTSFLGPGSRTEAGIHGVAASGWRQMSHTRNDSGAEGQQMGEERGVRGWRTVIEMCVCALIRSRRALGLLSAAASPSQSR